MAIPAREIQIDAPSGPHRAAVGVGLVDALGDRLAQMFPASGEPRRAFLVYDAGLPDDLVVAASRSLAHAGFRVNAASVQPSEAHKTLGTVARILVDLAQSRHERGDPVVALGGGVTGDVAGFVAATYRRGAPVVQCPTTLLAMVDAAVGGKTGVNLLTDAGLLKNMVGAFWQPAAVYADVAALRTLPDRDFRAGLAECIKHGLLSADFGDPGLLAWTIAAMPRLLERDGDALTELVARNIAVKARVVAGDEREQAPDERGGRALLNLGHTFAHAIETIPGLSPTGREADAPLRHGEAVGLGLAAACAAGSAAGRTSGEAAEAARRALHAAGLPLRVAGLPPDDALLRAMSHDKKVAGGRLRIIVPTEPGRAAVLTDPPMEAVRAGLAAIRA